MAWAEFHRREAVLRTAMDLAEQRRDGVLAWEELPDATAAFGTPDRLLSALQMRWHTRLAGAIERELAEQPADLERRVVHAWRRCAATMPGVRAVLDAHADRLSGARQKDWRLLASAAGKAGLDTPGAARIGEQIERRARAVTVDMTAATSRRTLLRRIRHALAA